MKNMKLYNTETRQKEEIIPIDGKTIRLYTCGPTVYNFAHIGNFRTYVFEDLLKRTLKFFDFPVIHVMNITDIDDKTLKGAIQEKKTLNAFTAPFIKAFFEDLKTLHIQPADYYPCATEYIPQISAIIQVLLDKKVAYQAGDGSIYYSISTFPSYGRLSHLHLDELKLGASVCLSDEYDKEHAADFVLWKAYDPKRDGEIFWESPFGKGRPGWHIECSAMAMDLLGESIDIHVGGVDNMFPHHENEIAQSEAFSGQRFVRYWLHAEHLLVDHKKMSKSLGNFYTLRDVLGKGYTGRQVRFLLLQAHYRTQLNFTFQGLDAAGASLQRLADFVQRLQDLEEPKNFGITAILEEADKEFRLALADDLNISAALAVLFGLVRQVNQLCDQAHLGQSDARDLLLLLKKWEDVLGFLPLESSTISIPTELEQALRRREEARRRKQWEEADRERDFILAKGYLIEDTPQGSKLKKLH